MKSMMRRTTLREIKQSFGRYASILAIVALGVAFFCGIKITKQSMTDTIADFYARNHFFDLHLMSTLGFDEDNVEAFLEEEHVLYAEGAYIFDVAYDSTASDSDSVVVYKTFSMPEDVNGIELVEGRLPQAADECVVDAEAEGITIGDVITISTDNEEDTVDAFVEQEFTVVGTVYSTYYVNFERGTTNLGGGQLAGFVYVLGDAMDCDYYTDVFVCFDDVTEYALYDEAYDDAIDEKEDAWEAVLEEQNTLRYRRLLIDAGYPEEWVEDLEPEDEKYYILDRNTNMGYACFESDSEIVNSVAKVFPIFFILVAALVCMTTMNRMVEDQRTQIGVLKALGYRESAIMGKYMTYSGSAAFIGCMLGFFVGTYFFPQIIWFAYQMMYVGVAMDYLFSPMMLAAALGVSLFCCLGTTWFTCHYELHETAASLMRPKAPKAGKRVLFERITFIWSHLSFLAKVSVRNVFRYKKRFFMMIIGISGCTALLLTGFGVKDSIDDFAHQQYDEIEVADGIISLTDALDMEQVAAYLEEVGEKEETVASASEDGTDEKNTVTVGKKTREFLDLLEENLADYTFASTPSWDILIGDKVKTTNVIIPQDREAFAEYMILQDTAGESVAYPQKGEAVISNSLADMNDIAIGDEILLRDSDMNEFTVTVSGIFVNHVYNYVIVDSDTYADVLGEEPEYKSIYFNYYDVEELKTEDDADGDATDDENDTTVTSDDTDDDTDTVRITDDMDQSTYTHAIAAVLLDDSHITAITINQDTADRLTKMLASLNYVVLLIIGCAAALAFIVLYNLTNINITERIREIATIKVLGFFKNETSSYVFRENRVLTAFGCLLGLGLGVLLHTFVMDQIQVDMVYFSTYIAPKSFLYSVVLTFVFNFCVNLVMAHKLEDIDMAESLKSVD